jgi:Plasmid pRiA4b ORF-3-like protein
MQRDNWLEKLSMVRGLGPAADGSGQRERYLEALGQLEKALDGPAEKRSFERAGLYGFYVAVRLTPEERKRSERLCARLWQSTGTGRTSAEEALLGQVAVQAQLESLPFFQAAVETKRERDSFQPTRRRIAVASVAFLAQQTGDAAAHAQLEAWLTHPDVAVRIAAVDAFARIHMRDDGGMSAPALERLQRIAREEQAFAPRFLARGWLRTAGAGVPVDAPEGVIAFRATLGRVSRTVELASTDSLVGLASAILNAFGWDHDHLYAFALTGDLRDRRFVLPGEGEELVPPGLSFPLGFEDEELIVEKEGEVAVLAPAGGASSPMDLPLGAFGFRKGHRLVFRYDFGDNHRFQVTVVEVKEKRHRGARYPRVSARAGRAPEQYPRWE